MRIMKKYFLLLCSLYCVSILAAPMSLDQLKRQVSLIKQQIQVLERANSALDKPVVCREGFKLLDLFYQIDPRLDVPQEAMVEYNQMVAGINQIIEGLKAYQCVPPDPRRAKFRY